MKNSVLFPCVFGVSAVTNGKITSALVEKSGKMQLRVQKNNCGIKFSNVFLVRGFVFLILGFYYTLHGIFNGNQGDVYRIKQIDKVSKSLNVHSKSVFLFAVAVCSMAGACFLLGYAPIAVGNLLAPKSFNILLKRFIISLVKIAIIVLIMLLLKVFPTFRAYYMFNSACAQKQSELGQVNFLTYFVSSTLVCTCVISLVGLVLNKWYSILINLAVALLVFVINYEVFAELQKLKGLNKIFEPIYSLVLKNPSHLEQKCVNIALEETKRTSTLKSKTQKENNMGESILFSEAYVMAREILQNANCFEKSDLDYIFAEVLGKSRTQIRLVSNISMSDYKKIEACCKRRASGEPISKMFGHANFYGFDFVVTKDVLSPRMDTERLVEAVLDNLLPKQTVLDVGTGSGAIAITIAKKSNAKVTAVDISDEALKVAKQNAVKNQANVKFVKSDLFKNLGRFAKFDIIVSNPPYIPTKQIDALDKEVKDFDPILALDGGESGLDFYEKIILEAPKRLNKNGMIFFEVGKGQASMVKKLLQKNFKDIRIVKDYNKINRVVYATLI